MRRTARVLAEADQKALVAHAMIPLALEEGLLARGAADRRRFPVRAPSGAGQIFRLT
jgi:hypothetical protein